MTADSSRPRRGRAFIAAAAFAAALLPSTPSQAQSPVPPYMSVIVGGQGPTAAETASQNVLALNTAMFSLYDASGRIFRRNILAQHPVILALFSGAGGRFIREERHRRERRLGAFVKQRFVLPFRARGAGGRRGRCGGGLSFGG